MKLPPSCQGLPYPCVLYLKKIRVTTKKIPWYLDRLFLFSSLIHQLLSCSLQYNLVSSLLKSLFLFQPLYRIWCLPELYILDSLSDLFLLHSVLMLLLTSSSLNLALNKQLLWSKPIHSFPFVYEVSINLPPTWIQIFLQCALTLDLPLLTCV